MNTDVDVYPRVVRAGDVMTITMRVPGIASDRACQLRLFSKVNRTIDAQTAVHRSDQGALRARLAFPAEGEYIVDLLVAGPSEPLASVPLFAVRDDLLPLRPFKGDTHMHTTNSDGRHSPVEMAVAAGRRGMDFIAITDHDVHGPSADDLETCRQRVPHLCVMQGEEVTVRGVGGHILSLGASEGIGKRRHTPECNESIPSLVAEIGGRELISPLTAEQYAHVLWVMREVKRAGGCAVMAHPYWVGTTRKYYGPRCVYEQLAADRLLDGVELMGGSPNTEQNLLAVARHTAQAEQGCRIPVLGGSDAHHVDDVARLFTILFAEALNPSAIKLAIRSGNTVACDQRMTVDTAVFGRFELVEYAYFLIREYFPRHDRLCADQAQEGLRAWERQFWQT